MTKKVLFLVAILSLLALSMSNVVPALAAEPMRGGPANGGSGGYGNQGSLGTGTGVPVEQNIYLNDSLDEYIHTNLATVLGITPTELTNRLDNAETLTQIALSLGFDTASISTLLQDARAAALEAAVADGLIAQDQADWLTSRGTRTPAAGGGYGTGLCDGTCINDGVPQMLMDGSGKTTTRGAMNRSGR